MRGRAMDGWLRIDGDGGVKTKAQLARWVSRGVDYARSLLPRSDERTVAAARAPSGGELAGAESRAVAISPISSRAELAESSTATEPRVPGRDRQNRC